MENSASPHNNDKITILSNYNASDAYKDINSPNVVRINQMNNVNSAHPQSKERKKENKMASPAYIS